MGNGTAAKKQEMLKIKDVHKSQKLRDWAGRALNKLRGGKNETAEGTVAKDVGDIGKNVGKDKENKDKNNINEVKGG